MQSSAASAFLQIMFFVLAVMIHTCGQHMTSMALPPVTTYKTSGCCAHHALLLCREGGYREGYRGGPPGGGGGFGRGGSAGGADKVGIHSYNLTLHSVCMLSAWCCL